MVIFSGIKIPLFLFGQLYLPGSSVCLCIRGDDMVHKGDRLYVVVSGRVIRQVEVQRTGGGFVTVKFQDTNAGMRVRESRLFRTLREARKTF